MPATPFSPRTKWRDLVLPKEHGSWSLALEPLALGLLAAPSAAGGALALAVAAGFLARRPLKIAWRDPSAPRRRAARRALAVCIAAAAAGVAVAVALAGPAWLPWLAPFAAAGAAFLSFDLHQGGREETAEIIGAAAFAFVVGPLAILGGESAVAAVALIVAMLGRAVPAVMLVRACVRGGKTGEYRAVPALAAAGLAVVVAALLAARGPMPFAVPLMLAVLGGRAALRLLRPAPIRARTLGLQELALGVAFVALTAAAWPR